MFNAFMGGVTPTLRHRGLGLRLRRRPHASSTSAAAMASLRAILRPTRRQRLIFDLPHVEVAGGAGIAAEPGRRCRSSPATSSTCRPARTPPAKSVLHDWDDARASPSSATCRARWPRSRVLVVERPLSMDPDVVMMSDLTMLAMVPGGRERTEDEYRALLEQAGLNSSERAHRRRCERLRSPSRESPGGQVLRRLVPPRPTAGAEALQDDDRLGGADAKAPQRVPRHLERELELARDGFVRHRAAADRASAPRYACAPRCPAVGQPRRAYSTIWRAAERIRELPPPAPAPGPARPDRTAPGCRRCPATAAMPSPRRRRTTRGS